MRDDVMRRGMISVTIAGPVAMLMLDRPDKLNALDRAFWTDLPAVLDTLAEAGVRAIILAGHGERAFCVGGDVASFAALQDDDDRRHFQIEAMEAFAALENASVPTIAAIHGFAFGGGCELALACDVVIAADDAVFALPEARFGLVPGYGAIRAPAMIGAAMTRLMVYAGERIDAAGALRCGLAQRVVPRDTLMAEAHRIAAAIAAAPETAIAAGCRLIGSATDAALVAQSIAEIATLHATPASRSAVAAFLRPGHSKDDDAQ